MNFYFSDIGNVVTMHSSLLNGCGVKHAFSTRHGGVSELIHTSSMNIAFGRGDANETVKKNVEIFLGSAGIDAKTVISVPQIHSKDVMMITKDMDLSKFQGLGVYRESDICQDGYVTDSDKISLMIKVADCAPILMCDPENKIIAAVHSGWKGTVAGISCGAIEKMESLGAERGNIICAVGACIHSCCYEVGEDFYSAVAYARGSAFADTFVVPHGMLPPGGVPKGLKFSADIVGMIVRDLVECGILRCNIDIADECTCCNPLLFHSHRASGGIRGTMGAVISL